MILNSISGVPVFSLSGWTPLSHIFNSSISQGLFPLRLKRKPHSSYGTFKASDTETCNNYGPISAVHILIQKRYLSSPPFRKWYFPPIATHCFSCPFCLNSFLFCIYFTLLLPIFSFSFFLFLFLSSIFLFLPSMYLPFSSLYVSSFFLPFSSLFLPSFFSSMLLIISRKLYRLIFPPPSPHPRGTSSRVFANHSQEGKKLSKSNKTIINMTCLDYETF